MTKTMTLIYFFFLHMFVNSLAQTQNIDLSKLKAFVEDEGVEMMSSIGLRSLAENGKDTDNMHFSFPTQFLKVLFPSLLKLGFVC